MRPKELQQTLQRTLQTTNRLYKPPPNNSITQATPNPAPLLMPRIEASASGLRNIACNIRPHTDNTLPVSNAVRACGKR